MDDIEVWAWIILLLIWFVVPAICVAMVAGSRNREAGAWFLYGLLCWPIALTHVLILPPLEPSKPVVRPQGSDEDMSHIL